MDSEQGYTSFVPSIPTPTSTISISDADFQTPSRSTCSTRRHLYIFAGLVAACGVAGLLMAGSTVEEKAEEKSKFSISDFFSRQPTEQSDPKVS